MATKSHALYQREKQPKKSAKSTLGIESKSKKELEALTHMSDDDIDLSDIPELDDNQLNQLRRFYRPVKQHFTLRLDADVLAWFKKHSDCRELMNKACRLYMLQRLKKRGHSSIKSK